MLLKVPEVLPAPVVARIRSVIEQADWSEQRPASVTPGVPARLNRQLPEDGKAARAARAMVLDSLGQSVMFFTGALPKKIFPPLFNRYDTVANQFDNHVDTALRTWAPTGTQVRADIAVTIFLSDPREYEGGELVIEDHYGMQSVKLRAGDAILYPAANLHRVQPVTRGVRLASYFWVESMVHEDERRRLLYELDMSILALRARHGESAELARLTGCYHNLMRMWATT